MPKSRRQGGDRAEVQELRIRLEEAEETIAAIRSGAVDAFLVHDDGADRVYTLEAADRPYRVLVESMQQGALVLGADGTVLFGNRRFAELVQVPSDRLLGSSLRRYVPTEFRGLLERILEDGRGGVGRGEISLARGDGTWVPAHLTVSSLPSQGNAALCAIVTDLTERRQHEALQTAQLALQESEQRFRAVFEQGAVALAEVDLQTQRILRANSAYSRLTGFSAGELQLLTVHALIHPEDRPGSPDPAAVSGHDGEQVIRLEQRYVRKDGSTVSVDRSVAIIRNPDGRPVRALEAIVDVSGRREAEARLRDVDRRKDEFLATLAHELRNPLAPIRSAVEVLRLKGTTTPDVRWAQDVIERQSQQLARLVDDLLDLSRITRNQLMLRREPTDLSTVIQVAIETSRPLIAAGGHRLDVRLPERPVMVDADLTRLAQVFSNLLNNAAKYTDPGGSIRLTVTEEEYEVLVSVRDSGVGIPPEMLPRVFEMFAQVDRTLERSQTGLGIGLALVRRLVQMHGGHIEVRSHGTGTGSEFTVRLPVLRTHPLPAPREEPGSRGRETPSRILVVDDNRDNADSLGLMLRLRGHEVRIVYDGESALAAGSGFVPSVILLDLGMPQPDGFETCRRIRKEPWGRTAMIVALTGWGQVEDRRKTRETGFDHHLVKPVDPLELARLLAGPPAVAREPLSE